ncbi:hypothetical protein SISSUDRAFT_1066851 [Sistotremastrum suecicum HHB10207 ss-3]|uniref:Uncharacterized protein n=1 Tax=Sistotremastrum suecicum HHB10207 ss-3 TaxID=1314776 RepID=A0A165XTJ4_9AGAM|nr:hypothetical protein SISSUDRAFT_1066851 [Sistotremastrum suecicum HHB10207 ss-3]
MSSECSYSALLAAMEPTAAPFNLNSSNSSTISNAHCDSTESLIRQYEDNASSADSDFDLEPRTTFPPLPRKSQSLYPLRSSSVYAAPASIRLSTPMLALTSCIPEIPIQSIPPPRTEAPSGSSSGWFQLPSHPPPTNTPNSRLVRRIKSAANLKLLRRTTSPRLEPHHTCPIASNKFTIQRGFFGALVAFADRLFFLPHHRILTFNIRPTLAVNYTDDVARDRLLSRGEPRPCVSVTDTENGPTGRLVHAVLGWCLAHGEIKIFLKAVSYSGDSSDGSGEYHVYFKDINVAKFVSKSHDGQTFYIPGVGECNVNSYRYQDRYRRYPYEYQQASNESSGVFLESNVREITRRLHLVEVSIAQDLRLLVERAQQFGKDGMEKVMSREKFPAPGSEPPNEVAQRRLCGGSDAGWEEWDYNTFIRNPAFAEGRVGSNDEEPTSTPHGRLLIDFTGKTAWDSGITKAPLRSDMAWALQYDAKQGEDFRDGIVIFPNELGPEDQ